MLKIHRSLVKNSHIKHASRVQYNLFLKETGIPFKTTEEYIRREFTKEMDPKKFEKEYLYYIEHLYGLKGSRKDYSEFSCETLASTHIQAGDCNGCPFVVSDIEDLCSSTHFSEFPQSRKCIIIISSYFDKLRISFYYFFFFLYSF